MDQHPDGVVDLFWTGGWDSTFRLLQLLLLETRTVQPYYVIDPGRASTLAEVRAMVAIKEKLTAEYGPARGLLLPTKFTEVSDIGPDPGLTERYERLLSRGFLGSQYEWLPRFCAGSGLGNIELAIHKDDKAHAILEPFVGPPGAGGRRLDESFRGSDVHALFRFFVFPVFDSTKLDMQKLARAEGFCELLDLTWFCHTPRPGPRPCGVCNPCVYTIEEGLGRRVPFPSRLRYHARLVSRVNHLIMKYPRLRGRLRRLKRRWLGRGA